MQTISREEYENLLADAEVLARDRHGEKVMRTGSGDMVKLFRIKRLVSSARIWPYAQRFVRAADRLQQLGIPTVQVRRLVRIPHIRRDAVIYTPLPGRNLRAALAETGDTQTEPLIEGLVGLLVTLHQRGVYFRAIHFGNVLVIDHEQFGLIDVSEARFFRPPLGPWRRARNFEPMLRYEEDRSALARYGIQRFIDRYVELSGLRGIRRAMFKFAVGLQIRTVAPP